MNSTYRVYSRRDRVGSVVYPFLILRHASVAATCLAALFPTYLTAQSVVSDGGTATNVTIGTSGLVTVDIAPADSASISHNTYSSFSVPTGGVNLNNGAVGAGTILNEVTSANTTTIEGPLTVIGQKADVIVANPNGVAVNGGRFQNTGNIALTTGMMGRTASGQLTTTVAAGAIDIGPGGLSGTMEELALISKSLRIDGPLRYDLPQAGAHANIIAGDSTVSFDRLRGGFGQDGSGLLPWALTADQGNATTDTVIVDITGNGSLTAGRISVTVTDQGAGVRFAGDQLASAGGFRLTSTGQLELAESRIMTQGSVNVTTGRVVLASSDTERAEIASEESGVTIAARSGDIELGQGRIAGRIVSTDNLASSGGVTLSATGDITSSRDANRVADLASDAGDLANPQNTSNVVLMADGALRFAGLNVTSTDDFRLTSNGAITLSGATGEIGGDFRAFSNAALSFDVSTVIAQSDIRLDGTDLRFGVDDADQARTELLAENGGFTMRSTTGDILNFGSLLQGNTIASDDVDSLGGMTIYSAGDFINRSLSVNRLAVAFGEAIKPVDETGTPLDTKIGNLFVEAAGDIRNETGRLFSNADITLNAGGDILNETTFTAEVDPLTIQRFKGSRFVSSLFLKRKLSTVVSGDFGDQAIAGEQAFILGIGNVSLTAQNIRSIGADITGANVAINATGEFANEARQVGQFTFRQSCKWFCKTSGSTSLRFVGGTVTASGALSIEAGSKVTSLAGTMSGARGLTVTAPLTEFIPAFSPTLIEHPAGLTGLFSGRRGYLAPSYIYGSLQSTGGDITINGDADLGQANTFTLGEVVISGTQIESVPATPPELFERRPIGLLWNVFD
ncbi:filamentous hemagglutinin N-terminal domain-containing protein (plasmid) [Aquicoccus sp. G2-2]|uniref:filamentous hemagglutinin N-terminal domain-containing protein n=1 Tax=Aquicoccus sp. G2-2 TaxID=3092120 RepID=UPI002AE04EC6|nr:filamentous hemagglutinin N-terminal domain-containing protein [Aquicoccus sp. G2-2]MEA1111969.1 filamentous hemagglutinin N-terminal domain-containing protein [Aquicoccus sp. G2-2]